MADLKQKCVIEDPSAPIKFEDLADGGKYADCKFDFDSNKNLQIVLKLPKAKEIKAAPAVDTTTILDTPTTVATVSVPSPILDIPKPPPKADGVMNMTVMTGAIAGAIGSSAGPMLSNFLKSKLKSLLKSKNSVKEEPKEEEATDCKTHNVQCNTRSARFSATLNSLETKLADIQTKIGGEDSMEFGNINLEELEERISKLEKRVKKGLK